MIKVFFDKLISLVLGSAKVKLVLMVLIMLTISGCDSPEVSDVKKAFKMASREPDAVVFGDVKVFTLPESQEKRACFSANSKNEYGGMTGFKTYDMEWWSKGWNTDVGGGLDRSVDECVDHSINFEWCYKYHNEKSYECSRENWREKYLNSKKISEDSNEHQSPTANIDLSKFAIPPHFDWAGDFREGLAPVAIGKPGSRVFGYINKSAKMVISPKFTHASKFKNGLALACIQNSGEDKCGFIDAKGNFLIKPLYNHAYEFSEDLAAVYDANIAKWGFINTKGEFAIEPKFEDPIPFCESYCPFGFKEGLALVKLPGKDGKFGFINTQGLFVIDPIYDWASDFSEGLASVGIASTPKFIDKNGRTIINLPQMYAAGSFSEGKAVVVNKDQNYGYLDKSGNIIINPRLGWAHDFHDGMAIAGDLIDGEVHYGFINTKGDFVIKPDFSLPTFWEEGELNFSDDLAPVRVSLLNKWGYINRKGNIIFDPVFDFSHPFSEGLAVVVVDNKWGYITKNNNFIIDFFKKIIDQIFQFFSKNKVTVELSKDTASAAVKDNRPAVQLRDAEISPEKEKAENKKLAEAEQRKKKQAQAKADNEKNTAIGSKIQNDRGNEKSDRVTSLFTSDANVVRTPAVVDSANCEKPEYPRTSRRMEEEGTVLLKFLVGVDGKVIRSEVEKSSGHRRLDDAARTGLSLCQFKPATVDGNPEQAWSSILYTWRLE